MKRIILLIAVIAISNFPISCNPCGDAGVPQKIRIISFGSEIGNFNNGIFDSSKETGYDSAAIRIMVDEVRTVNLATNINAFYFGSIANACSPTDPTPQLFENIRITSTNSLIVSGVEYFPNEDLSNLFRIQEHIEFSVAEYIEYQNDHPYMLSNESNDIIFQLISNPDEPISQKFTFTFTFDDGLVYDVVTPLFTVE